MRARQAGGGEDGSGLLLALIVASVLAVLAASFVLQAEVHARSARTSLEESVLRGVADGGVGLAVVHIHRSILAGATPSSTLSGVVPAGSGAGAGWGVVIRRNATAAQYWKVAVGAVGDETYVTKEVVLEKEQGPPPIPGAFRSGISTYFGFEKIKNAEINGNNHLSSGLPGNPAGHTYAVSHKQGVVTFQGGSGALAGNGTSLAHTIDANRVDPSYGGETFPKTPLEVLDLDAYPPYAQFFPTLASWNTFVSGLGGTMPPNQFLVLEFLAGDTTMFGGIDWGDSHHILIWHADDPTINSDPDAPKGVAGSKNIHLGSLTGNPFKGIAILDNWGHVNGNSYVRGGFVSLSGVVEEGLQGNTRIEWSTEAAQQALFEAGHITGDGGDGPPVFVSYRETVRDQDIFDALSLAGRSLEGEAASSTGAWVVP